MKRFLIVLSFFFFLIFPSFVSAQSTTPTDTQTSQTAITTQQPSWWDSFWSWITGIFIKTDYSISERPSGMVISDMNDYGKVSDSGKHSSSGTRLTTSNNQICYKGNVIKKVVLNTSGYQDSDLANICPKTDGTCEVFTISTANTGCDTISIKDLAQYFIQTNQKFYCDSSNNLINIESNVISAIGSSLPEIPSNNFDCYKKIYNDFYLVPKNTTDSNEENSKDIVKTPLPANKQKPNSNNNEYKDQLDKNVSPDGTSAGLGGLRPASW